MLSDITFEAESLDDAYLRLANHFGLLGDPVMAGSVGLVPLRFISGRLDLAPTDTAELAVDRD